MWKLLNNIVIFTELIAIISKESNLPSSVQQCLSHQHYKLSCPCHFPVYTQACMHLSIL